LQKLEKMSLFYKEENCRARETLENKLKLTIQKMKDIYRNNMKKMLTANKLFQEEQLREHHDRNKGDAVLQLQLRFKDVDETIFLNFLEHLEKVCKLPNSDLCLKCAEILPKLYLKFWSIKAQF
jgi:hypothetical protein